MAAGIVSLIDEDVQLNSQACDQDSDGGDNCEGCDNCEGSTCEGGMCQAEG